MRKGKEIDFLVLMRAKGGSPDGAMRILEDDIKAGVAYLATFASGDPASFPDGGDDAPVRDLKVSILPAQSGSGDPSPTNVRPISGWTGLTLNHSGADTSDPETLSVSWQSQAGTVYGGTLDVTTGVLTVTHGGHICDGTETVRAGQSSGTFMFGKNDNSFMSVFDIPSDPDDAPAPVVSHFNGVRYTSPLPDLSSETFQGVYGGTILFKYTLLSTAGEFVSYLQAQYAAGTPLTFVLPLANPGVYQLTPHEVKTLLGDNTIWANCGPIEVEYRADPEKYVEKRIGEAENK